MGEKPDQSDLNKFGFLWFHIRLILKLGRLKTIKI